MILLTTQCLPSYPPPSKPPEAPSKLRRTTRHRHSSMRWRRASGLVIPAPCPLDGHSGSSAAPIWFRSRRRRCVLFVHFDFKMIELVDKLCEYSLDLPSNSPPMIQCSSALISHVPKPQSHTPRLVPYPPTGPRRMDRLTPPISRLVEGSTLLSFGLTQYCVSVTV